jgi:hypothetical protein
MGDPPRGARTNRRYGGGRPLLVFTDNKSVADTSGNVHIQYRWLPRETPVIRELHQAANALRRSLEPSHAKRCQASPPKAAAPVLHLAKR